MEGGSGVGGGGGREKETRLEKRMGAGAGSENGSNLVVKRNDYEKAINIMGCTD